jgi:hypothetical protein
VRHYAARGAIAAGGLMVGLPAAESAKPEGGAWNASRPRHYGDFLGYPAKKMVEIESTAIARRKAVNSGF